MQIANTYNNDKRYLNSFKKSRDIYGNISDVKCTLSSLPYFIFDKLCHQSRSSINMTILVFNPTVYVEIKKHSDKIFKVIIITVGISAHYI